MELPWPFKPDGIKGEVTGLADRGSIKGTVLEKSNLFESMKFRYFGPIDGHDVLHLVKVLQDMKQIPGPKLLHCVTVKEKASRKLKKTRRPFMHPENLTNVPAS